LALQQRERGERGRGARQRGGAVAKRDAPGRDAAAAAEQQQ
jgi:hypothetical protein